MVNIDYNRNKLIIDDNEVKTQYPIEDVIEYGNKIIVLLYVPADKTNNRNIIAFNENADVIWTIEQSQDTEQYGDNPYMSVSIEEDDIVVDTWKGMSYKVDPSNGEVNPHEFRR